MYRYAYRLTGSVQDAEDLTQQVFLVGPAKMGQLRKWMRPEGWLFAILRNCFLKDGSGGGRTGGGFGSMNMDLVARGAAVRGGRPGPAPGGLNRLPDAFRLVVVMFYFEECSYRRSHTENLATST